MKQERLSVGDLAPSASVIDIHGNSVELKDLWANGPTVLTFLRHFG